MKPAFATLAACACLLALSPPAPAAETSVDATTIFRVEHTDTNGTNNRDLMPLMQFLGLDVTGMAGGNLSLHVHGWGRADLADRSFNNDLYNGNLTYGFLRYRFNSANADLRAGRFFVADGIIHEHVDGFSARTELPLGFGISAFGGATVHTQKLYGENSDGKGDTIAGGRLNYRYRGVFELGASGVYESNAPTLRTHWNGNHRMLGGDVWLSPHKTLEIIGHTTYNTETAAVGEHSYLLNIKPADRYTISGEFNDYRERSLMYSWAMFSKAALNPSDHARSIGGIVSGGVTKWLELAADYRHYTRETGNADRYGGEARLSFAGNVVRSGLGYHYLRAGQRFAAVGSNPSASYHELRAFVMADTKNWFTALDVIDYVFTDKVYNERSAVEGIASLGYHLTPALALSGDVTYGRNPQFTEEVRGLVRLTYAMTYSGKGGSK